MASFQAKIGWKRPRKRGNTNYRFVSFLSNAKLKIPNKEQKIQKIIKYYYGFISSQNKMGNAEKRRK